MNFFLKRVFVLLLCIYSSTAEVYPSSCRDLDDGVYDLKLMDGSLDESPIVSLQCNSGYTILDYSMDSGLSSYFHSFMKFHHSSAGPTNDYHVNWEGWYKPGVMDENSNYIISPDCHSCDESHQRQLYGSKTAYMMTGTLFGCFWNKKGEHNFDQDFDSYQCYYSGSQGRMQSGRSNRYELTDESSSSDWDKSGVCSFSVRESNKEIPNEEEMSHDACTTDLEQITDASGAYEYETKDTYHLKPSIGTDGEFCVCVQPSTTEYFEVDDETVATFMEKNPKITKKNKNKNKDNKNTNAKTKTVKKHNTQEISSTFQTLRKTKYDEKTNTFYLYKNDFTEGTYRIQTCGDDEDNKVTYKVMEDVIFDFNADYDNVNSDTAWWPHESQNSEEEYPGAGGYFDTYFLGFFAGITIECSNVVLDLNGHTLRMSDSFYHQQRWFTTVTLLSQYFLPGQGIGMFGASPTFASNVLIKDGTLGLTSHHGIHGHFNKNVVISNVHVRDFETHGIQFNGFDGITIDNCEIGPTSSMSYFKGEYGHGRTLLKRFRTAAEHYPDTEIRFRGRDSSTTMPEIVDELEKELNMAYDYVVNGKKFDEDDESWISAKSLFIDNTNLPNGAAMYGIFLNTYGASVLTYNLNSYFYSYNAVVSNTKIHGLEHAMNEYTRIQYPNSGNLFMNPLHAPFDAQQLLGELTEDYDFDNPKYYGSLMTDACLALSKLENNNWPLLQAQLLIDDIMLDWVFEGDKSEDEVDFSYITVGCNTDAMIHSGKGINGLRIDGVDGVLISNVEVYDITEQTPLGKEVCGSYDEWEGDSAGFGGGHFRQAMPMQTGFSGTMLQGININAAQNVVIKDVSLTELESHNGPVFGISIWPAVDVTFEGKFELSNFNAGTKVENGRFSYDDRPNIAPEVCGVRMYESYTRNGVTYYAQVTDNTDKITVSTLNGHVKCLGDDTTATHFGIEENNNDNDDVNNEEANVIENGHLVNGMNTMNTNKNMIFKQGAMWVIGICIIVLFMVRHKLVTRPNKLVDGESKNSSGYGSILME